MAWFVKTPFPKIYFPNIPVTLCHIFYLFKIHIHWFLIIQWWVKSFKIIFMNICFKKLLTPLCVALWMHLLHRMSPIVWQTIRSLVMGLSVFTMTPSKQMPTGQTQTEQETSFKDIAPMAGILTIFTRHTHIDWMHKIF
mgnify:CR=1 FL=1